VEWKKLAGAGTGIVKFGDAKSDDKHLVKVGRDLETALLTSAAYAYEEVK
jgi:hypothetical protein